jgi:hypothetical protein
MQKRKKMLQQLSFDWEHEAQKDSVYLQEEQYIMEERARERQPALITVIDKDKILEKQHELEHYTLPF